ncbi:ACP S-malonyltransferase [Mycobacterium sp. 050134]|uniref:ACP S-malonyltransferase n=1 Tax=Mycobacterium sp. 050134 TaxID=3096111 RepID=UPI002EDB362D
MTAFLFPGQGSQHSGMLAFPGLCQASLEEAGQFLNAEPDGPSLGDLDTAESLGCTANAQLALLIVGVAAARSLIHAWRVPGPTVVAGHSVGAFAAAVICGALTFTEALQTVALRATMMERICAHGHWGMAAVLGIDARSAGQLALQVGTPDDPLWLANDNSRRQVVFSGTRNAIRRLMPAAEHAGAEKVQVLDVAVASHCPLQGPVRDALADHLRAVPDRPLSADYLTNTRGRRVRTGKAVLSDLVESVSQPVQWRTIAEILPELGVTHAIEMPPGHVLTRLSEGTGVDAVSVSDVGFEVAAHRAAPR